MQFIVEAENKETGVRVEVNLYWTDVGIAMGRDCGTIRIYENGQWVRTERCFDGNLAIKSYEKMKKDLNLSEIRNNSSGSKEEDQKKADEYLVTMQNYGKAVPKI